jgi:hypothetical protein
MECIIAYLLLTLFIDLALEIVCMDCTEDEAQWVKRSLWGQIPFDCGTRAVGAMATVPRQHAEWKKNRFRVERGNGRIAGLPTSAKETGLLVPVAAPTGWLAGSGLGDCHARFTRNELPEVRSYAPAQTFAALS